MTDNVVPIKPKRQNAATVTEEQSAREFAMEHTGKLLYCHDHKSWFLFDGAIWRMQRTGLGSHRVRETCLRLSIGAGNRNKMQTSGYCNGVEKFTKNDPVFARCADDWDSNIWLGGTPKAAIDLATGVAVKPRASDMLTKTYAVDPADTADCPLWFDFLEQATAGDAQLIRFLCQICGYALTGSIAEHALFFIFGPGGNGKGVFLSTLQGILNDYSVVAPMAALEAQRHAQHTTDLAMMRGARLVSASESNENTSWNEQRIKALTGGDRITARFMHANNMTFTPQLTLLIIGNHKPNMTSVDEAMRRRINMIPFTVKPETKDPNLTDKLRAEWPGILRWMIEGCLDWQKNGFVRPSIVEEETEKYFEDQNMMQEWIDTACEVDLENSYWSETSTRLFKSWSSYADSNGVPAGSAKSFKPAMEGMGFKSKKGSGPRYFFCIRLRDTPRAID